MKLTLSENIRSFRKQRKLTQEKLADALGVTVGAVYKWESGQSQPELNLVVELADFFDTSVDALLGYRMKDNSLDSTLDRIITYCKTLDPTALAEAEKMLGKYPHSFRVVYGCASVYLVFGTSNHDRNQLRRALELLEQSKVLLAQNDDPKISEATICGDMSIVYFLLDKKEESIELLKKYNANGVFNGQIGAMLSIHTDTPEEAAPFLSEAFTDGISNLLSVIVGFVFLFRSRCNWASATAILTWGIDLLRGIKTEDEQDALEKAQAEMLVLLAYVQGKSGMQAESSASLRRAAGLALHFDSMPDYSLKTMRFAEHLEQSLVLDIFGATASGSIAELIRLLNDQHLSDQWEELLKNE